MVSLRVWRAQRRIAPGAFAALACGGLLAPAALASPFDQRVVAADATWTMHVDVEAVVNSTIGQFILTQGPKLGLDLSHLDEAQAQLGVNPLDVVYGVTIYGAGEVGEDPVLVVTGSAALEDILDKHVDELKGEGDAGIERIRIGDATGYSIHGEWLIAIGEGPRRGTRRFVAAQGKDALRDALRVIVGAATHRRDGPQPAAGSFFFVDASVDLPDEVEEGAGRNAIAADILKSLDRLVVDMGESAGDMYVNLSARIQSSQEAQRLLAVAQGFVAAAQLVAAQKDNDEAAQLTEALQGLSLDAKGDMLSLSFRYSAEKILNHVLEELQGKGGG